MAGYYTLGNVTKPWAAVDAPFEAQVSQAGVLHVAAALVTPGPGDVVASAVCEVRRVDRPTARPLATLTLDHRKVHGWEETRIVLRASGPHRLRFECRPEGVAMPRTVWARPLLTPPPQSPAKNPLIVLLSVDTLRADHIPGFGGRAHRAPALGRLADEGLRFVETTADGTWTLPSHFALLFSRVYGFPIGDHPLISLAQALADHGYATAAFTSGGFVGASFGFCEGFDHYVDLDSAYVYGGSDILALPDLVSSVRERMRRDASMPLFVFMHTYAVHEQTLDEVEWAARYSPMALLEPAPARIAEARRWYRRLVRRTDRTLEPLFDDLRREATRRPVALVLVSDHGEAFGEHDNFRHGDDSRRVTLHDEIVRVPLVVWAPGIVAPGTSRRPTMLLDVAPSILSAAGSAIPPSMVGTDLWPLWHAADAEPGAHHVVHGGGGSVTRGARGWALRTASRKLIVEAHGLELYDLERDPAERHNVAHRYPRAVSALRSRLSRRLTHLTRAPRPFGDELPTCPFCSSADLLPYFAIVRASQRPERGEIPIDDDTRDKLHALGYVDF